MCLTIWQLSRKLKRYRIGIMNREFGPKDKEEEEPEPRFIKIEGDKLTGDLLNADGIEDSSNAGSDGYDGVHGDDQNERPPFDGDLE